MKLLCIFLFAFFCLPAWGQIVIKGRILDSTTNKPVPAASVFLNNSSIGCTTNENGYFQLQLPAGRFDLIVSSIGYETLSVPIRNTDAGQSLTLRLVSSAQLLDDVRVEPFEKNGWEQWGAFFVEHFIGSSAIAKNCILRNKEVLRFRNSKKNNELSVHALAPLVIENRALGYEIVYHLQAFSFNFKSRLLFYEGYPYFKNMKGGPTRQKKWEAARAEVYYGSIMHFMRAVYRNSLQEEGFEVKRVFKMPNPSIQPVQDAISKANDTAVWETKQMYSGVRQQPEYIDVLGTDVLPGDSIAGAVDSTTAELAFEQYLQVSYKNKPAPEAYQRKFNAPGSTMTSQIILLNNRPVEIQANGIYYQPTDLLTIGFWSWSEKIATLLPFDYKHKKQ